MAKLGPQPMKFARNNRLGWNIRHMVESNGATVKVLHRMGATNEDIVKAYNEKDGMKPCMYFKDENCELTSRCYFEQNGLALPRPELQFEDGRKIWLCDHHYLTLQHHLPDTVEHKN